MRGLPLAIVVLTAACGRVAFDREDAGLRDASPDGAAMVRLMIQVNVPSMANIWGAGHAMPPAPSGSGAGVPPTSVLLPTGTARLLELTSVTGTVNYMGSLGATTADGVDVGRPGAGPSYGGISDVEVMRGQILAAVVLDDTEPVDPAPPTRVQDPAASVVTSIVLRQQFFVGDGLTGTGAGQRQIFVLPDSATRLYFGFGDSAVANGLPGSYSDNVGNIDVMLQVSSP